MIGLDTNVLVRILVDDDADQNQLARALLEDQRQESRYFICAVVLAETDWLLRNRYGYSEQTIRSLLQTMLETSQLVVEYETDLYSWLSASGISKVQLSDFLISWRNRDFDCTHTLTFDRQASTRIPGMELLQ